MNNIIPKTISKTRLEFYKGFGIVEALVIGGWIVLSGLFIWGLPIGKYSKILAIVLTTMVAIPLILPVMPGVKGWYAIVLAFKYFAQPKKYRYQTRNDTSLLVPYAKIVNDNYLKTHKLQGKHQYLASIAVQGFNISLLSVEQQALKIQELHDLFKYYDFPLTFMKIDLPPTNQQTIAYYQQQLTKCHQLYQNQQISNAKWQILTDQITDYIKTLQQTTVQDNGVLPTQKQWYCFVYAKTIKQLEERINDMQTKFDLNNFTNQVLTGYELVKTLRLMWNPYEQPLSQTHYQQNQANISKLLAFNNFQLKKHYFKANNIYYNVTNIYDYPLTPNNGWGANLANNEQTVVYNIWPINRINMRKNLNKAINNAHTKNIMNRNNVDKSAFSYEIQAYEALNDCINGANEVIKNVNISFLSYGTTYPLLKESQARLTKNLKELDIKINPLRYRQLLGYSTMLPKLSDPLMHHYGREIPAGTLASAWPMINSGLNDHQGLYLGTNNTGDNIIFDQFCLNDKRKNHNQIIIGTSGSGKSFFTKKEIVFHLNMGRVVITIDPEREYQNLCHQYDGQWVDTSDATSGRINPLQVLDNNFKSELEKDNNNISEFDKTNDEINEAPISNHLRLLTQWFKTLYHDLTNRELRLLIQEIQKTYQKFDITNKTNISKLTAASFPIMSDLHDTICATLNQNPSATLTEIKEMISYDFLGDGQYSTLWNGHTTLAINNQLIVYDVLNLFDEGAHVIAAQLYLVLAFIKGEVKRNRFNNCEQEMVIVVDEAHLAIDKDNPAALNFMYQMVKRIRKYHGAMIITTQNLNDFTGTEDIKKKTTAIINNTQYTFIFNLAPQDLMTVTQLYRAYGGLSAQENDYIARAKKGECLFIVSGYERHCIQIQATTKEQEGF